MLSKTLILAILVLVYETKCAPKESLDKASCDLGPLAEEIASYDTVVKRIIEYTVNGPFKGKTYDELAKFVDTFGARPSGSIALERSIDYMVELTKSEGIEDIVLEELEVPQWERAEEKVTMIEPRLQNMPVLGLGRSVSTPSDGITAEVVVVHNFTQLDNMNDSHVKDKIVLFVPVFTNYSDTVVYRNDGASKASLKGAAAALVKSITPFSINSPHTGGQRYADDVKHKIPAAAITLEDADLITRLSERGEKVVLHVQLSSSSANKTSRNTIVDLKGCQNPEKLVIVSGHIDSWDIGQGAMDDGGGVFISWAVPVILKRLNLKPRRTIRAIFWTAEELGMYGARAYDKLHRRDSDNINFVMESDEGTFAPLGLTVGGSNHSRCILGEILKLFDSINASTLIETASPGSDISVFTSQGIPGASLYNDNERYFWYHHSAGDTMNVETPENLDLGAAFWTAVAYIIADLSIDMPRQTTLY